MSLFIGSLAFEGTAASFQGLERLGILLGSLVSGVFGYVVLRGALNAGRAYEPSAEPLASD